MRKDFFWELRDSLADGTWQLVGRTDACPRGSRERHVRGQPAKGEVILMQGSYYMGRRHGYFEYRDICGQLTRDEFYSNGELNGEFHIWDDGNVQTLGRYSQGLKAGLWLSFDDCFVQKEGKRHGRLKYTFPRVSDTYFQQGKTVWSRDYGCTHFTNDSLTARLKHDPSTQQFVEVQRVGNIGRRYWLMDVYNSEHHIVTTMVLLTEPDGLTPPAKDSEDIIETIVWEKKASR